MFKIQPLRMRLLMLTKSKLQFFYTRIKDQHRYLGPRRAPPRLLATGEAKPILFTKFESGCTEGVGKASHDIMREGKTQRRQIENKYFDLRSPTPAPNPSFQTLPSSLSGNSIIWLPQIGLNGREGGAGSTIFQTQRTWRGA